MKHRTYIAVLLIGVACTLLQPHQPQSMIATVLLAVAVYLVAE